MVNLYFGAIACTTIHTKHRKITYVPSSDRKWLIFTFFIPRPVVSEWFFFQILRLRIRTTRYYCAGILPKSVENFFYNSVPFNVHVNQIGNDISGPVASAFRNVNRPKIRQKMRSIIAGFERRAYKRHLNNRRVHPLRHHNNDPLKISIVRRMTRIFFFAESIYIFFFFSFNQGRQAYPSKYDADDTWPSVDFVRISSTSVLAQSSRNDFPI